MSESLTVAVILALIASTGGNVAMWIQIIKLQRVVGSLIEAVKKACPWGAGECPSFKKAKDELSG